MDAPTPPTETLDIGKRVAQYVKLRDLIGDMEEAHKEAVKPYKHALDQLNNLLLDHLNAIGADHVATPAGTVHKTTKKSATIADRSVFRDWVISQQDWDLVDLRANSTAVEDHIKTHNEPPPGVNWSTYAVVGVRRK
jgi:hypothetical protein